MDRTNRVLHHGRTSAGAHDLDVVIAVMYGKVTDLQNFLLAKLSRSAREEAERKIVPNSPDARLNEIAIEVNLLAEDVADFVEEVRRSRTDPNWNAEDSEHRLHTREEFRHKGLRSVR